MRRAYIGLGANLGDPPAQLRAAIDAIGALGTLLAVSPFYRSAPLGPADQPEFCNAVCVLETALDAQPLMAQLLAIEHRMGRLRTLKWGPRTIDLDLLHVEGHSSDSEALKLPHPGIAERNFVLVPLADVAPDLNIPGIGRVADAAGRIGRAGLTPWLA